MIILKKESMQFLNEALRLPALGTEQDWDLELADPSRVREFVNFYQERQLNSDQKQALMSLIIASLEDLSFSNDSMEALWKEISRILLNDFDLHRQTIEYWACHGDAAGSEEHSLHQHIRKLDIL